MYYIVAGVFVGIVSAIVGLVFFRWVLARRWLTPKYILCLNLVVIALVFVYILYVRTVGDFFAVALIAGSQIGSLGSFSKSIVSKLVPTKRQSRFFSLYQFSQEATGWIGPLIVATLQTALGGGQRAFLVSVVEVCLVEIAIGLPLLLMVDVGRGEDCRKTFDDTQGPREDAELGRSPRFSLSVGAAAAAGLVAASTTGVGAGAGAGGADGHGTGGARLLRSDSETDSERSREKDPIPSP